MPDLRPLGLADSQHSLSSLTVPTVCHDGQPLRAEIEAMLDELAAAIVRDIFLDPRPVSMKTRYGRGTMNAAWLKSVGARTGAARRMAPGEVAPA